MSAVLAGFVGSLTGLGGGVVLVPLMVLAFGVDLKYAVGASLVAVVATSSGAAAAFVREGFTNVRVAIVLEVATVLGALAGAAIAGVVSREVVAVVFGLAAIYSAWGSWHAATGADGAGPPAASGDGGGGLADRLSLHGTIPTPEGPRAYRVERVPAGLGVMFGAGVLSALAGVGGGILKVLAMDRLMRMPFKASTTTSNFMIGVTASASAGVYFHRGQLEPSLCAPVALGALAGAVVGASVLPRLKVGGLRRAFAVVVALAGVEVMRRALMGGGEAS